MGSVQGFPIKLDNNAFQMAATSKDAWKLWKSVAKPVDFSVNWSTSSTPWPIQISRSSDGTSRLNRFFYVSGFNMIATSTTITYEGVSYVCDSAFAICNIQHSNCLYPELNKAEYPFEAILSFQNVSPTVNPTAPNVILLCRPFKFGEVNIPGWSDVEKAVEAQAPPTTYFHPKTLFMDGDNLVPSMAYETCINARVGSTPSSLRVRVCVGMQPLILPTSTNVRAKCSDIPRYRFRINGTALLGGSLNSSIYFKQSTGGSYPSGTDSNLFPIQAESGITDPTLTFQILVSPDFFGQDPQAIASQTAKPRRRAPTGPMKCYMVDPKKDIKNGQIMVDPATGETLSNTLNRQTLEDAGGDPDLARALQGQQSEAPGILPGDFEYATLITLIVIGSLLSGGLFFYTLFLLFYRKQYANAGISGTIFILVMIFLGVISWIFSEEDKK